MDHNYLIRVREHHRHHHHRHQQQHRSLVVYQPDRILFLRRLGIIARGGDQPPTNGPTIFLGQQQHSHGHRHQERVHPFSSSSSSTSYFFTRSDTTILMRRPRRDLQTYPPPVVVVMYQRERIIQIPDEVWHKVGTFLDAPDIHNLRRCHPRLRRLLLHNAAGWKNLCRRLWRRRHHVCPAAKAMIDVDDDDQHNHHHHRHDSNHPHDIYNDIQAYELSVQDSTRDILSDDELCDTVWWFRFKTTAGVDWLRDDPWHQGSDAVRMIFLRNGRVISPNADNADNQNNNHNPLLWPLVISWQWIELPTLLGPDIAKDRGGRTGAYLRLTVSGREVPTYIVQRFPANWGFIMENCWGVFASFELPRKKKQSSSSTTTTEATSLLLQLTGPIPSSSFASSASSSATNVDANHNIIQQQQQPNYPIGKGTTGPPRKRQRSNTASTTAATAYTVDDLTSECYFIINGQNQWREAFLYNIGARHLPHGPNAMEAFRHACEEALLHGRQ